VGDVAMEALDHADHASAGMGPYLGVDGDELWLPVEHFSLNRARSEAASHCAETGNAWLRSRYVGRETVGLHDHEDWEACDPGTCCEREAWHFELYEGTYRG